MRQQFQAFCATDDGATAIEYSFIASLVAIAGFATMVNRSRPQPETADPG
jgi:Flp pilus assembly pilin Flp